MKTVYVFGGPNGSGKSTQAMRTLPGLDCQKCANADLIASGLAPFAPETAALQSGRLMLQLLEQMKKDGETFAFLKSCRADGFEIDLTYVWLCNVDLNVARVAARVQAGGHNVPEDTIRRRYSASLRNLRELYLPISNTWHIYENSEGPRIVAEGTKDEVEIYDARP